MKEFFLSDEFRKYRREQGKVISRMVESALWDGEQKELQGILQLARSLMKMPIQLCPAIREQLEADLAEDYKRLTKELVRESLSPKIGDYNGD
jgi:hypothetical protein